MKVAVGAKIAFGFGSIIVLMVVSAAMAYVEVSQIQALQSRVATLRVPTVVASKDVVKDLNQLANKGRQAVLSAEDKKGYADGKRLYLEQAQLVDKDFARMEELAPRWTLQANRDRLAQAKAK